VALLVCLAGCAETAKHPQTAPPAPAPPTAAKQVPRHVAVVPGPREAALATVLRKGPFVGGPTWRWRNVRMAELNLRDLDGRVWKLEDLDGKVALVNVWATWCQPCTRELPLVQRLHDSMKGREDTIVLSMNVDEDPEDARKYAAEHNLTFPVLPASRYVRKTVGPLLKIPRTWIVGSGLLTAESQGFHEGQGEAWLDGARAELEKARSSLQ
jgi:thiol-disulfide isomerase/thioredoxin